MLKTVKKLHLLNVFKFFQILQIKDLEKNDVPLCIYSDPWHSTLSNNSSKCKYKASIHLFYIIIFLNLDKKGMYMYIQTYMYVFLLYTLNKKGMCMFIRTYMFTFLILCKMKVSHNQGAWEQILLLVKTNGRGCQNLSSQQECDGRKSKVKKL